MQKRHFLVQEVNGEYQLRELDGAIANAITLFGTITGQARTVESTHWVFYFMNCQIAPGRADQIATQLTNEFTSGLR